MLNTHARQGHQHARTLARKHAKHVGMRARKAREYVSTSSTQFSRLLMEIGVLFAIRMLWRDKNMVLIQSKIFSRNLYELFTQRVHANKDASLFIIYLSIITFC